MPKSNFSTQQPWKRKHLSGPAPPKSTVISFEFWPSIYLFHDPKRKNPPNYHPSNHTTYTTHQKPSPKPRHCTVSRGTFHHQSGGMIMRQGFGVLLLVLLRGLLEPATIWRLGWRVATCFFKKKCGLSKKGWMKKMMRVQEFMRMLLFARVFFSGKTLNLRVFLQG